MDYVEIFSFLAMGVEIDLLICTRRGSFQQLLTRMHYFTLGYRRNGEYFSLEHSHHIESCTLGHIHLLEGDQIDS